MATRKTRGAFIPEVLYSYTVDDEEHRSDTRSFFEFSTAGWNAALRITAPFRRGSTVTCYVNPADPDDATLDRNPSIQWLAGIVPIAMMIWGLSFWRRPVDRSAPAAVSSGLG